ncbi:CAF1 family ribonuclease [Aspergillus sclerotialis]|uniref:CAF1 family ribonuclease n=1 Tax=Aspergillus sclerotialis TaxID=2070753 RepID=A0A3A2ZGZ4_9EURO|nr:CAF1 family ribonuclease [Aspergillus sclerotialis]
MDITVQNFESYLPKVLDDLTSCLFVSLDLELSGIAKGQNDPSKGTQTLQERYEETRKAADKYQVLQVGLTICHEDTDEALYTLKPYNIYVNPIIDRKLDLERDFVFQSSAVEFLLQNQFRLDPLLQHGVPYVSREEEQMILSNAFERRDRLKTHYAMDIKDTDHESLAFLENVRRLVDDWLALGVDRDSYLNIPPPSRVGSQNSHLFPSFLNRFQKRLVHQLIDVEYPTLVTVSERSFVQIIGYDEGREKAVQDQRMKWTRERISKQTGSRWIAEALAGGDLSNLSSSSFRAIATNCRALGSIPDLDKFSEMMKQKLKSHRPVLVGHNIFTDLVYFCRHFFGPLPERVEDFQILAHELFPTVIDTKYMATHECGSINPTSSLIEICDSLTGISIPRTGIHHQHSKYNRRNVDHEAGYDSLLTARIFIKLSAQLRDADASKRFGKTPLTPMRGNSWRSALPELVYDGPVPVKTATPRRRGRNKRECFSLGRENTKASSVGHESTENKETTTLCIQNKFDSLQVDESADRMDIDEPNPTDTNADQIMTKVNRGELIPRFESGFWSIYGNKLRVFGTEERVCDLGQRPGNWQISLPFGPVA